MSVRLLLDDMNFKGRDAVIAALDAHPNIEIRMFNSFAHRTARAFDFLADFNRVNHRMHNKLMVMANTLAIVGGRNIGIHYVAVDTHANFRDPDIAVGGRAVRETSGVFDHFFNDNWAFPISALVDRPYTEDDLRGAPQTLRELIAEDDYSYPLDEDVAVLKSGLEMIMDDFAWAPARIVRDDPAKMVRTGGTSRMLEGLNRRLDMLDTEVLIESPYFVPRDRGVEKLKALHDPGVRIRVLTNSPAPNDVLAAHAGYAKRRKQVVKSGTELYELRADAGAFKTRLAFFSAKAALHAKTVVFDRKDVFIGSFNLGRRSSDINTEAGLYVESPQLAAQVIAWMDEGVLPENSYQVLFDEDGDLYWVARDDGEEVRYDRYPLSTFGHRFTTGFIQMLPVENQL